MNKYLLISLFTFLNFNLFSQEFSDVTAHWFVNGKKMEHMKMMMIKPNVPTPVEVYFTKKVIQEDGREIDAVITDFKEMHGKVMHMIVAKNDLSVFKHVHPYFDPITGRFQIVLNLKLADPDNFHTENAR